jgi:hypothetical protein
MVVLVLQFALSDCKRYGGLSEYASHQDRDTQRECDTWQALLGHIGWYRHTISCLLQL